MSKVLVLLLSISLNSYSALQIETTKKIEKEGEDRACTRANFHVYKDGRGVSVCSFVKSNFSKKKISVRDENFKKDFSNLLDRAEYSLGTALAGAIKMVQSLL